MAFEKKPAEWRNPGVEPSEELKTTGWKAGMKAPAEFFNWQWNRTYLAIKELQEKASEIKTVNNMSPDENGNVEVTIDYSQSARHDDFDAHIGSNVYDTDVHGLRITEGVIEYWNGSDWLPAQIGTGFSDLPIMPINELHALAGDGKVILTWHDPPNTQIGDIELSRWKGTKIVRKTNGYPVNENDGVVVISSTIHNQYYDTPFVDTNVYNGETYYYAAFPYTEADVYTNHVQQRAKATPLYGLMDPDWTNKEIPEAPYVPYYGFTKLEPSVFMSTTSISSDEWTGELKGVEVGAKRIKFDEIFPFNRIRPVLFKDGQVVAELNKEDFTIDTNGNEVDIISGNAGDVMIEIPKIYFKLEDYGNKVEFKYSQYQVDETWKAIAHTKGGEEKDFLYVSAYMGSNVDNKLRSLSDKEVETRKSIHELRTLAQANGKGYELINYFQYTALTLLYIFYERVPSINAQSGNMGYDENYVNKKTGTTNQDGMFADKVTSGTIEYCPRIKSFGIEDLYRGYNTWLEGIMTDYECNYLLATTGYNERGEGYTLYKSGLGSGGVEPTSQHFTVSLDINAPLLPIAETSENAIRGKFSHVTYVTAGNPFITGAGNPSDTYFDQVFTRYIETDPNVISYDASRIVYL